MWMRSGILFACDKCVYFIASFRLLGKNSVGRLANVRAISRVRLVSPGYWQGAL